MEEQLPAFNPPLASSLTVFVPSVAIPKSRLRWRASMPREQYTRLCDLGHKLQVFCSLAGPEWLPMNFEDSSDALLDEKVDFSFVDRKEEALHDHVLLNASVGLSRLIGKTVSFTYRLVDASNSVTKWYGTEQTNGTFTIEQAQESNSIKAEDFVGDAPDTFAWKCDDIEGHIVIANLTNTMKWKAWGFRDSQPFRFETESSSLLGITALALIQNPSSDTYITCPPVMLTPGVGTLCLLKNGDIRLQANGGTASLHIHFSSSSTWTNFIPDQCNVLNTESSDFLFVSFRGEQPSDYIHILPLTGKSSVFSLTSSNVTSLFPTSFCMAVIDRTSRTFKVLPISTSSLYRFAADIDGGDIMVVSGHTLTPNWTVALLTRNQDRVDTIEPTPRNSLGLSCSTKGENKAQPITSQDTPDFEDSEHTDSKDRSSVDGNLLLLFVYLFQWLLENVLPTTSPDTQGHRSDTPAIPKKEESASANDPPRLVFNLPEPYCLIAKGEDISHLSILADGISIKTETVQDIGDGHWLFTNDGLTLQDSQIQEIEISLCN